VFVFVRFFNDGGEKVIVSPVVFECRFECDFIFLFREIFDLDNLELLDLELLDLELLDLELLDLELLDLELLESEELDELLESEELDELHESEELHELDELDELCLSLISKNNLHVFKYNEPTPLCKFKTDAVL
jgi:hypothetical protein